MVDEVILVGALEAASGGNDYDDPGGWGSLIADAIERNEVVCEDHLSVQVHGLEIGATPVATKPTTKVSFFITDVLMAQNGVEFVAGVDTYNGTTAYTLPLEPALPALVTDAPKAHRVKHLAFYPA